MKRRGYMDFQAKLTGYLKAVWEYPYAGYKFVDVLREPVGDGYRCRWMSNGMVASQAIGHQEMVEAANGWSTLVDEKVMARFGVGLRAKKKGPDNESEPVPPEWGEVSL